MSKYLYSSSFVQLETSKSARLRRAECALRAVGVPRDVPIDSLRATNQASASICRAGPLEILVSYSTVVAYRLPDGSCVATPRNYHSKTTDRSVDAFTGRALTLRLPVERFAEAVASRYAPAHAT